MANEAVIIELLGNAGDPIQFTCIDNFSCEKGAILWYADPRTVSGAAIATGEKPIAGIAAAEKVAGDGSTRVSCYTNGIFDLKTVNAPATVTAGDAVVLSGQNLVARTVGGSALSGAYIVGYALETAAADEVIAVRVKL